MKKTERLEEAAAPDGTALTLYRHDGAYYIRANGIELMSTRRHHSEEKLAELVCAPLQDVPAARVLIGGLGFGFTLRAALRVLGPDARVIVAEIMGAVIAWNENPEYELAGQALADDRVSVVHDDVGNVLATNIGAFDGIMLDVDNGAEFFTTAGNAKLYGAGGITSAIAALRPGGRVAYWLDRDDPGFEAALRDAGLEVDVSRVRSHVTSGPSHSILVGRTR